MKSKPILLIIALFTAMLAVTLVGCGNNKNDTPPAEEKEFLAIGYEEFAAKSEEFLTVTNYMALLGADLSYSDAFTKTSLKASLDMSMPEDVALGVELSIGRNELKVHLGEGRLYVNVTHDGKNQKDSTKFNNDLADIIDELRGGNNGLIAALEYLVATVKEAFGAEGDNLVDVNLKGMLRECTFLYRQDERVDEYKILANHSYDGKLYESSLPFGVFVEFKVGSGCIISLNGTIERENGNSEIRFERRTNSSPRIELPSEEYAGDLLDGFEELYSNRAITMNDFMGEWTCEGVTLVIGNKIMLIASDGEVELSVDNITCNYLTLVSGDEVYIARLADGLELTMPSGEKFVLSKA